MFCFDGPPHGMGRAPRPKKPTLIRVGNTVQLVEVPALAKCFGLTTHTMRTFLKELEVDELSLPDKRRTSYVMLFALECALFRRLLPNIWDVKTLNRYMVVPYLMEVAALENSMATAKDFEHRIKKFGANLAAHYTKRIRGRFGAEIRKKIKAMQDDQSRRREVLTENGLEGDDA